MAFRDMLPLLYFGKAVTGGMRRAAVRKSEERHIREERAEKERIRREDRLIAMAESQRGREAQTGLERLRHDLSIKRMEAGRGFAAETAQTLEESLLGRREHVAGLERRAEAEKLYAEPSMEQRIRMEAVTARADLARGALERSGYAREGGRYVREPVPEQAPELPAFSPQETKAVGLTPERFSVLQRLGSTPQGKEVLKYVIARAKLYVQHERISVAKAIAKSLEEAGVEGEEKAEQQISMLEQLLGGEFSQESLQGSPLRRPREW